MLRRFIPYYRPHLRLFLFVLSVSVVASVAAVIFPLLTRRLLNTYLPTLDRSMILLTIALLFLLTVVKAVCTYIRITWGHILGVRMEYDMRSELFQHIQKLSFTYFDNVKTGHIMSRISTDLNLIVEIAHHAPEDMLIGTLLVGGAFFFMFSFNAALACIALVPVIAMACWVYFYGTRMYEGFRSVLKKIADINSAVENSVQGIREVKSYANEDLEIKKFEDMNYTLPPSSSHTGFPPSKTLI